MLTIKNSQADYGFTKNSKYNISFVKTFSKKIFFNS